MRRMRGTRLQTLALLLLLLATAVSADTVSGYVVDVETNQRLADVEVAFLIAGDAGLAEMVRRSTDAQGQFSFSGPFLTSGATFSLVAHYEGLEYATDALEVGAQDQVIIEVYDGTEDESRIQIDGHHLFLSVTPGGIDVAQLIHIDNLGTSTYIGRAVDSSTDRRVFRMRVPAQHQALQGHSGQIVHGGSTELYTSTPLPPGRSQVAFTLQVPGDDFDGTYEHNVLYPTARLELFLQPGNIELPEVLFEDLGEIQLHDQSYRHYRVQSLSPGRTLTIPLPFSQPVRWALKWGMVVFVLAMLAAALSLTRSTIVEQPADRSSPDRPSAEPDTQRLALLQQIAQIDAELATATDAQAADLQRQRDGLMVRLRPFYSRPASQR